MDSTGLNSAMDGLIKNGYLRKLSWNTYSLEEYTADEIAYRKYIKRNGNVESPDELSAFIGRGGR